MNTGNTLKLKFSIIVAGGFDGTTFLNIVEIYDPSVDRWYEGKPMTSGRSGHASAVSYQHCSIHYDHLDDNVNVQKIPS